MNALGGSARPRNAPKLAPQNGSGLTEKNDSLKLHNAGNQQNGKNGHKEPMASKINAERPLYVKEKFEARTAILDRVRDYLQAAAGQKLACTLIEIVGVTWIGKTWLLRHIEEYYKRESERRVGERLTIAIYVDLEKVAQPESSEQEAFQWFTRFLRLFISALESASDVKRPNELRTLPRQESALPLDPIELQTALSALSNWFVEIRSRYFPILILDALEKIDASLLAWVEREILIPFNAKNQTLIITAGRAPVKWREPEFRFYSDLIRLGALEEWGKLGDKGVPAWIHERYALGHAGLGAKLYEAFLSSDYGFENIRALSKTPQEHNVVGPILKKGIDEIVLNDIPAQDIPRQQMNLRALLWAICVLRIFSPETLKVMVEAFGPAEYRDKSYLFFRQAGFYLIGSNVAAWRPGLGDYRVEPLVRRIMSNALRITDGCKEYVERHQTAEKWYREALFEAPSAAPSKLPEALYHFCVQIQLREPAVLSEKTTSEIRAWIELLDLDNSPDDVDKLIHRFKNDAKDGDLEELRRDMIGIVGKETFAKIIEILQEILSPAELEPA